MSLLAKSLIKEEFHSIISRIVHNIQVWVQINRVSQDFLEVLLEPTEKLSEAVVGGPLVPHLLNHTIHIATFLKSEPLQGLVNARCHHDQLQKRHEADH